MKKPIAIKYQRVCEARRFWEILNQPELADFSVQPRTVEDERNYLRQNREKRMAGLEYSFSIYYGNKLVGAVGVMIDQRRPHIGEIGYFLDSGYWGRGIAVRAVKLAEEFIEKKLKLHRLEIAMIKKNKASQRVAQKCEYKKEGVQRGRFPSRGRYLDCYVYSKITTNTFNDVI